MKSFSIKNYSKVFICAIAAFIGVQAKAQDLVKHIPHNSIIVVGYNPASLIQKGGQLGKDVVAKTFTKRYPGSDSAYDQCSNMFFQKLMSDPSAAGINGNTDQYVFRQNAPLVETEVDKIVDYQYGYRNNSTDPKPAWVFLFSLNDPEKFLNATRNCSGAITKDVAFERNTIKGFVNRNFLVAVNGNTGMIFKTDESYFYYTHNQDTLFDKEQLEEFVNADSIFMIELLKNPEGSLDSAEKQAFDINYNMSEKNFELRKDAARNAFYESFYSGMKTRAIALLEGTAPSLASNEIFNSGRNEKHDAWFWINTSYTDNIDNLNMMMRLWGGRRHGSNPVTVNPADPYTPVYIQDNYYMSFLNFNKGKAEMTFKSVLNPNLAKLVKKAYKAKQDKALYKYIDGSSLLGYISTAVDLKAVGDAYEKIYLDYFNAMYHADPSSEYAGTIAGAAEIMNAFLDKEAVFNTLNGKMIFAVTGMKEVRIKYKTYEYDENYESKEVEEESIEKQPEVILAAAIGNHDKADMIFNGIKKIKGVTQVRKDVLMMGGSRYFKLNIYLIKTKDAIIITNSSTLAMSDLSKGLDKSKRISKTERKKMKKSNFVANWQMATTFQEISRVYGADAGIKELETLASRFKSMDFISEKVKNNSIQSTLSVNFNDGEANALSQIFELLKQMNIIDGY